MVKGTDTDRTRVGRLGDSPLAELLAYAFRSSFTGQLLLDGQDGARQSIDLSSGAVCGAAPTRDDVHLERLALGEALPNDTLRFVEAHAERLGSGLIGAARALALLSEGALGLTMRKLLELRVLELVSLPEATMFAFFPAAARRDTSEGPVEPLEPLGLILKCLLVEPSSDRFRRHIQAFERAKLQLVPDSPALHGSFPAPLRNLVQRMRLEPQTVTDLLSQGVAADHEVYALVHLLRLTHQIRLAAERPSSLAPRRTTDRVPRTISGGALRISAMRQPSSPDDATSASRPSSHPFESPLPAHVRAALKPARVPSSLPPRASLEPPNQTEAELQRRWPERAAESRALQEWANAQGDPSGLERSVSVVARLARLFPRNARIRYYCGCLLAMTGQFEPALRELRHALQLEPNDPETLLELDRLRKRRG